MKNTSEGKNLKQSKDKKGTFSRLKNRSAGDDAVKTDIAAGDSDNITVPREEYEGLLQLIEELKDQYLRAAADMDNFRKRTEKERENLICHANEKLLSDLLPILDNLERALDSDLSAMQKDSVIEGIKMINSQLHGVLRKCGLETLSAVGGEFDPTLHEAVSVLPSEKHTAGTVVAEAQKGYALKGKVLRHSMVHVASDPGSGDQENNGKENEK